MSSRLVSLLFWSSGLTLRFFWTLTASSVLCECSWTSFVFFSTTADRPPFVSTAPSWSSGRTRSRRRHPRASSRSLRITDLVGSMVSSSVSSLVFVRLTCCSFGSSDAHDLEKYDVIVSSPSLFSFVVILTDRLPLSRVSRSPPTKSSPRSTPTSSLSRQRTWTTQTARPGTSSEIASRRRKRPKPKRRRRRSPSTLFVRCSVSSGIGSCSVRPLPFFRLVVSR